MKLVIKMLIRDKAKIKQEVNNKKANHAEKIRKLDGF